MSEKRPRKPLTPEHKAKISEAIKASYADPEVCEAIGKRASKSMKAYHARAKAALAAFNGMVQRAHDKARAKQDRQDAKTARILDAEPVKVGRWSYPARTVGGKLQRNERRDGSGAWVAVA